MVCERALQLFGLACVASVLQAGYENNNHVVIAPQDPVIEIGTNFTATCVIIDTAEVTADDLYWKLSQTVIPKELYTKINSSALNVTVLITNEKPEWLFCHSKKSSHYISMNNGRFIHGIWLKKSYRPESPKNLSCEALQEGKLISTTISCKWEAVGRHTEDAPRTYTAFLKMYIKDETLNVSTPKNSVQVNVGLYPNYFPLEFWVQSHTLLGTLESEHLIKEANCFVKTNPPLDVRAISEAGFPTSLLVNWTNPIDESYVKLKYKIRFCPIGSQIWSYVPPEDTINPTKPFRLQVLQPYTVYVIQVAAKPVGTKDEPDCGYWSNWSSNKTARTPEDRPSSPPDLWKTVDSNSHDVQLLCKDPEFANGNITAFNMRMKYSKNGNLEQERISVNADRGSNQKMASLLKKISLEGKEFVNVCVSAVNSAGKSPETCLAIKRNPNDREPTVKEINIWPRNGQLFVEWKHNSTCVFEYVIEWVGNGEMDWQRENKTTRQTAIKGALERFVCYKVSVYPIYRKDKGIGKPASKEAFLEQGAPLNGPSVKSESEYDHVILTWDETPQHLRRGFITNYTIFYENEEVIKSVTVPANTTSYKLESLMGNTHYDVWIQASTIAGSTNGSRHSFVTQKYAPRMVVGIVVGVSFGFLFLVLLAFLFCIYKKDVIKENLWPQIPNPSESTIGNWSPDYPLKAETPKENCVSGVYVLDEGMCEVKHGFEEDKTSLSLKKDKYLSEEHSSGIGGSSCMSSPRQSVSDSDEGADMADTTASTVQYSSVVASSGYKGQTPIEQPQHSIFSRSESTQPLLDSEENPDMLVQEGGRAFHSPFTRSAENQETADPGSFKQMEVDQQDFCPIDEDTEWTPSDSQSANVEPGSVSSYRPQLGGYRPQ
ncbi:interleukin-6 receptor subunit beta isoform X1 [Kryptolebias marmoratus]|nr:interleukin-6 receptor subunit beta isoform X1 [Kryptolebias marmoratus]